MSDRPYNEIQVKLSNGGMDKEASILFKQGRKVLELRSRFTTSFMGRLRYTFEAVMWRGHARISGDVIQQHEVFVKGITGRSVDSQQQALDRVEMDFTPFPDEATQQFLDLTRAAMFTPEEFRKGVERHAL